MMTENVVIQLIVVFGGVFASCVSALVGYIIWSLKDRKRKEEKRLDERREDQKILRDQNEERKTDLLKMEGRFNERLSRMEDKIDQVQDFQTTTAEAIGLIFESDVIQFDAFHRSGLMNGESEKQREKIEMFFKEKMTNFMKPKED